jgi:carbon-monoxide dehydrogenase small subunit
MTMDDAGDHRVLDVASVVLDGVPVELSFDAGASLLRALRDAGHTATTGACEQGECGSCTVRLDGHFVCACLVPAATCASLPVDTVTSLLSPDVTAALIAHGAVQCGFCTPGFVVSIESALEQLVATADQGAPEADEVRELLAGNLCRCTGYDGLVAAVQLVAGERRRAHVGADDERG